MSKEIHLTYCGMDGHGPTVREAKQDAARKIQDALDLNYTPTVLAWGDRSGIVWNTPNGVCSSLIGEDGGLTGTCFHGASTVMPSACDSMRLNLAQLGADVESDELPSILRGDDCLARAYRTWLGFQRAYRFSKANSPDLGDGAWHRWACDNSERFTPKAA